MTCHQNVSPKRVAKRPGASARNFGSAISAQQFRLSNFSSAKFSASHYLPRRPIFLSPPQGRIAASAEVDRRLRRGWRGSRANRPALIGETGHPEAFGSVKALHSPPPSSTCRRASKESLRRTATQGRENHVQGYQKPIVRSFRSSACMQFRSLPQESTLLIATHLQSSNSSAHVIIKGTQWRRSNCTMDVTIFR
jgi:hypothetical protein